MICSPWTRYSVSARWPGLSLALIVPARTSCRSCFSPHGPHGGDVERLPRVNQPVAQGDNLASKRQVPRDRAEFHQGLPFVGPGRSVRTKIGGKCVERNGQAAGPPVGA